MRTSLSVLTLVLLANSAASQSTLTRYRDSTSKWWGYRNAADKSVAIAPQFVAASIFRGQRAAVQDKTRGFAFIDRAGNIVERVRSDSAAAATDVPIPAPSGKCENLRCYIEQLERDTSYVGGPMQRNPSRGEGFTSAGLWKFVSGVIVIDDQGYEGGTTVILLPGITADSANRLLRIIWPVLPVNGDGCQSLPSSGAARGGGAFLKYRHGC